MYAQGLTSQLQLVAVDQGVAFTDAFTVDEHPIHASEVFDLDGLTVETKGCVPARRQHVIEDDVTTIMSAHERLTSAQLDIVTAESYPTSDGASIAHSA
jgi:hypothetical protein